MVEGKKLKLKLKLAVGQQWFRRSSICVLQITNDSFENKILNFVTNRRVSDFNDLIQLIRTSGDVVSTSAGSF